jgi:hypothetical protein
MLSKTLMATKTLIATLQADQPLEGLGIPEGELLM